MLNSNGPPYAVALIGHKIPERGKEQPINNKYLGIFGYAMTTYKVVRKCINIKRKAGIYPDKGWSTGLLSLAAHVIQQSRDLLPVIRHRSNKT